MPVLDDLDVIDPATYVMGVPHDRFRRLRREAPVYRHPEPDGPGFWAVTRHADVSTVLRDPETFSSWEQATQIPDPPEESLAMLRQMMLNMDPPEHTAMRRLVNKAFTPRHVAELQERMAQLAVEIVDGVAGRGECDFVDDVAGEMPLLVICEILGVPLSDRKQLFEWTSHMHSADTEDTDEARAAGTNAMGEMFAYAAALAETKRAGHDDDLVTTLLRSEVDGHRLSDLEFNLFFLLLVNAGGDTTRNLIAAGMLALIEHPDERAKLMADRSMLTTAIEEMLRFVTPVNHFRRTVMKDTELSGQPLIKGDKVAVFYASANRDEDVFVEPDRFDIARSPNDHLSFGSGPHFCLGASLARLEIRLMFEQILERLPDLELAGPVSRVRSNFINGIKEMPVRFQSS